MFDHCETCNHIQEVHAMDAPSGEQECMNQDEETEEMCDCKQFVSTGA